MKIMIKFIAFLSLLSFSAQAQINKFSGHEQMQLDCKQCHLCDTPTKAEPCLVQCPRYKIEPVRHSVEEAPNEIIINEVSSENDLYKPVKFSHRLHAEMSLMSGGCATCHHYNPPGKIVKCSTCHEADRSKSTPGKPDLKAAYHRQCMTCHTTWEEKSECKSCHALNIATKEPEPATTVPVNAKIIKSHPKISIPQKIVYKTDCEEGTLVTYYHNDHVNKFNLECTDCHNQESCASCHNQKINFTKDQLDDSHDKCSSCHDTENNCSKCHTDSEREPFNHAKSTNFNLQDYHPEVACITCHKSNTEFSGLSNKCENCHKDSDGYFDHAITGIILDETHKEFYCENCHLNNQYKKKPTCTECHEDDISYPKSIPGKKVRKNND